MTPSMATRSLLFVCLLLGAALAGPGAVLARQPVDSPAPATLPATSWEYFLLQAFHAPTAAERKAIHHLGMLTEQTAAGHRVSAVLDGFPAQQAGLRRGDLLISIDDQPFDPIRSLNPQIGDGQPAIDTPREVALTYRRDGITQTLRLTTVYGNLFDAYRSATASSVQQFANGNKVIGYVKLWSVDRSTDGLQAFRQLIDSLDHCDGLILDLRDSYGFINASHLDRFFPSRSSYFQLLGDNPDLWQPRQEERASASHYGRAMAILQNGGTRGGMELLSYQLGKLQRATVLGEATAGKAGQVSYSRHDDSLSYRPDADIRVDDQLLESIGVAPEQQVDYPLTESRPADPQLDAAVMALMQII